MIDWGILLLGAFLFAVAAYSEEKKGDEEKKKKKEYKRFDKPSYRLFIAMLALICVCSSLGFFNRFAPFNVGNWSLLVPMFLGLQAVRMSNKDEGIGSVLALIASIAVLFFILLASY